MACILRGAYRRAGPSRAAYPPRRQLRHQMSGTRRAVTAREPRGIEPSERGGARHGSHGLSRPSVPLSAHGRASSSRPRDHSGISPFGCNWRGQEGFRLRTHGLVAPVLQRAFAGVVGVLQGSEGLLGCFDTLVVDVVQDLPDELLVGGARCPHNELIGLGPLRGSSSLSNYDRPEIGSTNDCDA